MSEITKRKLLYIAIYTLNLFDWAVTLYWTGLYGIGMELNPVMRMALENPWVFTVIKIALVPIFLRYMWQKKHDDTAWFALGAFVTLTWLNINTILGL